MGLGRASLDDPGKAKVSKLSLEPLSKQNITRLDVAVEHRRPPAMVKERDRRGGATRDTEARRPSEHLAAALGIAMEPRVEAAALEKLVDEDTVVAGGAVPEETCQIRVAEVAEHLELGEELAVAGATDTVTGEAFDGDGGAGG